MKTRHSAISVILPTYNQAHFIRRAILSVLSQTYKEWKLIIINDGGTDNTDDFVSPFLVSNKIKYIKNQRNRGLGSTLNLGLDIASTDFIAYLPSDDYYYKNHLELLVEGFQQEKEAMLIYTEAKSEIIDSFDNQYIKNASQDGVFQQTGLQLVQVVHKKTTDRWVTREQFVTDSLYDMFWNTLEKRGPFFFLDQVTCNWSIHPHQRHKLINELQGGSINKYKHFYNVDIPLRFYLRSNKILDENELYGHYRYKKPLKKKGDITLKILLVGELSYNPDRILAFEEYGCKLYGLWANNLAAWTSSGPLPFGNITNIRYESWQETIKEIKPDIIYAQLNHGAVNLAHEVLSHNRGIPFVWHFNEGPSVCMRDGYWDKLIQLYTLADGKIFINPEIKEWYSHFIPFDDANGLCYVLDGDLAKADYFTNNTQLRLSESDGEIHTVVAGRMIGLTVEMIAGLSKYNIHIHAYTGNGKRFNDEATEIAPRHFHVYPYCGPKDWTQEFSQYDAAWLHCIQSRNNGDLMQATWDDFNIPCRISTYAAAGLPIIQLQNQGHIVAVKEYLKEKNVSVFFNTCEELARQLNDKEHMTILRNNMWRERFYFSFDYHVPKLLEFFKKVIENRQRRR